MSLYERLGGAAPFDPRCKLVTSPLVSPLVLAGARLALGAYALFTVLFTLVWEAVRLHEGDSYFSYFTDLSYIGISAYFCAAGVHGLVFALSGGRRYPLRRWPRVLQVMHLVLYSTVTTYPFIVTITYWALLASSETFSTKFSAWSNISQHLLNSVFVLLDILFTHAGPQPWLHLPLLLLGLVCYVGVAYITHATQGFYVYDFLDTHTQHGLVAAYLVGIAVAECIAFSIVRGVVMLRERIAWRSMVDCGGDGASSEALEDWEDVERPRMPGVIAGVVVTTEKA